MRSNKILAATDPGQLARLVVHCCWDRRNCNGACFEKDAIGDFAGTAEELHVGEPIVASKAADRLAFIGDECERRVATHGIAEFLKLAVDGVLPEARLKGQGI